MRALSKWQKCEVFGCPAQRARASPPTKMAEFLEAPVRVVCP